MKIKNILFIVSFFILGNMMTFQSFSAGIYFTNDSKNSDSCMLVLISFPNGSSLGGTGVSSTPYYVNYVTLNINPGVPPNVGKIWITLYDNNKNCSTVGGNVLLDAEYELTVNVDGTGSSQLNECYGDCNTIKFLTYTDQYGAPNPWYYLNK
jgi:hypothetical protein